MYALRTSIKNLTKDIKNLVSLKYLCEYENTIKETYEEHFAIETLAKTEIVKYYIDNIYVSSSCDALNPDSQLITHQPAKNQWISCNSIPHCYVSFTETHNLVKKKNRTKSPLYGELYLKTQPVQYIIT